MYNKDQNEKIAIKKSDFRIKEKIVEEREGSLKKLVEKKLEED